MVKTVITTIKRNTLIVLGAAIFASAIFYISKNPEIFTASVLSLQEQSFIVDKWRDVAYKNNSWLIDIFLSSTGTTPTGIDITISYDKESITIDPQNLSGQGNQSLSNPDENTIIIHTILSQTVDKSQSITILPFSGDMRNILLSEAVATLPDGTTKSLAIGTLNEITNHSK